jgi:hypothetical protein
LKLPAGTAKQKLRFSFTSNRPIAADVFEALEDLGKARAPRHPSIRSKLVEYCGLTGSELTDFFEIFTTEGGEPDLWAQRNLKLDCWRVLASPCPATTCRPGGVVGSYLNM